MLGTGEAVAKALCARAVAAQWRSGKLGPACNTQVPDRPARPARPLLLEPSQMAKRGKGGTLASRFALLHAVAHIELNAIDLVFDLIARFGAGQPHDFIDDWITVGDEEAQHFMLVADRLTALGGAYGDQPAHDGLWQAASATAHDLLARLAVVPLVLEARGLDVTPVMIERLGRAGDSESVAVLRRIYTDEIGHVATGMRWFRRLCNDSAMQPADAYKFAVSRYFHGVVKPPFNDSAREQAGLTPDLYRAVVPVPL